MASPRPFALTNLRLRRLFEAASSGILAEYRQVPGGRSKRVTVLRLRGKALQELGALCAIEKPERRFASSGMTALTLRLRGPDGDIAHITFPHHVTSIIVEGASSEAFLKDGETLARWLADRGVSTLLDALED